MTNLLKLHINLLKCISLEFRKKKKNKGHIVFLKDLSKQYLTILLNEYRRLFLNFDPEYKKQRKQYKKIQQLKKDLESGIKILFYLDKKYAKEKHFWDNFRKHPQERKRIFDELIKEIKGE